MSLLRVLSYAIEAVLSVQKEFYQIKIAIRKKIWKMLSFMLASKPAHGDSRQSKAKMIWFGDSNCFFLGLGGSEPSEMLPSLCLKTSLPMPPPCAKDYLTKTPTPDRRSYLGVVGQAGTRSSQSIWHVAITLGRHQRWEVPIVENTMHFWHRAQGTLSWNSPEYLLYEQYLQGTRRHNESFQNDTSNSSPQLWCLWTTTITIITFFKTL